MLAAAPQRIVPQSNPLPGCRQGLSRSRNLKLAVLGLVLIGFILGLLVTAQATRLVMQGYAIVSIKQEVSDLERENQRLRLEISRLKSPERIAAQASRLGLVRPEREQICLLPAPSEAAVKIAQETPSRPVQVSEDEIRGQRRFMASLSWALGRLLRPSQVAEAVVVP